LENPFLFRNAPRNILEAPQFFAESPRGDAQTALQT
jgi:hypothetical protein